MVEPISNIRWGGWTVFEPHILEAWGYSAERLQAGGHPIAICEAAMVPLALLSVAPYIAGSNVVYFIDNTSALH